MDQLQFGGNAGLRSLLVTTGFTVGSVVVLKAVGGVARGAKEYRDDRQTGLFLQECTWSHQCNLRSAW